MIFKIPSFKKRIIRYHRKNLKRELSWHKIYAILPKRIDAETVVWLQYIECKGTQDNTVPFVKRTWEYRLLSEPNEDKKLIKESVGEKKHKNYNPIIY